MTNVSEQLIRSGIRFLKDLQEDLGTEKGLEVWDKLREAMGDEVSGQVLFGILTGNRGNMIRLNMIRLELIGNQRIEAIKLIRECTGMGIKDAKDLMESVLGGRVRDLEMNGMSDEHIDYYIRRFEEIGCKVS